MLDQRLWRWPTLNQHLVSVPCWLGKLTVNMLEVNCFQTPMVSQPFVSQHKAHMREIGDLFPHRCRSSIYRVYMIWELAPNVAMCMKRIYSIIILADNCGCGVICHCGMSRGHCCILGTPLSSVFWQLTIPLGLSMMMLPKEGMICFIIFFDNKNIWFGEKIKSLSQLLRKLKLWQPLWIFRSKIQPGWTSTYSECRSGGL